MKRSEINAIIEDGEEWVRSMGFALPPWAHWEPARWASVAGRASEIVDSALGWDVTDFGRGDYGKFGLLLFTIRNGDPSRIGQAGAKPYAEKIMVVSEGQMNPMHFHFHKMEDIINRGGGRFVIELFSSTSQGELSEAPLTVRIDGIERRVRGGDKVVLEAGESICLETGMYHRFWAEGGRVLAGEVSLVNDDVTDNRFVEELGRFPTIDEDVAPARLLCSDYRRFLPALASGDGPAA